MPKNSQLVTEFLNITIISETFEWFRKDYVKKVDTIKANLLDKKKKLTKINKDTTEKSIEYSEFCLKSFRYGHSDKSKDVYDKELTFLHTAKLQMRLETEMGKETIDYFEALKKLELQRLDLIKRGLAKYLAKMTEIYGRTNNPEPTIKILETLNPQEDTDNFFTIATFFEQDDIKTFKDQYSKGEQITYPEVKAYFETFYLKPPSRSPLMMKQWKCTRDGGILKGFKQYTVIATVDYNLILVEDKDEITKPEKIMKMSQTRLVDEDRNNDSSSVHLLEVIPGLILDSKNRVILNFENSDTAEEFTHFLRNYQLIKEAK